MSSNTALNNAGNLRKIWAGSNIQKNTDSIPKKINTNTISKSLWCNNKICPFVLNIENVFRESEESNLISMLNQTGITGVHVEYQMYNPSWVVIWHYLLFIPSHLLVLLSKSRGPLKPWRQCGSDWFISQNFIPNVVKNMIFHIFKYNDHNNIFTQDLRLM